MTSTAAEATPPASPPVADRRPVTTEHHGRTRTDEYDWLRAKGTSEVTAYLEAENAWTAAATDHLAGLRDAIFGEIKSRTKESDLSVPTRNRGYWYYGRSFEGREYGTSCRVDVLDESDWTPPTPDEDAGPDQPALPGEQVLLDHDALAEGHDFYSVGGVSISPDANLLAYSTDTVGDERYVLEVKDLSTGELLPDRVEGVLGGGVWSPDGRDLYYCTVDDAWRRDKVWRHRIGSTDPDELRVPRDRRAVLGRHRTQPHPALPGDRERLQEHLRGALPRLCRPGGRVGRLPPARGGAAVQPRARRDRRRGPLPGAPRPRRRRTSSSAPRRSRPRRRRAGRPSSRTTSGSAWRTPRRTPDTSWCTSAAAG